MNKSTSQTISIKKLACHMIIIEAKKMLEKAMQESNYKKVEYLELRIRKNVLKLELLGELEDLL